VKFGINQTIILLLLSFKRNKFYIDCWQWYTTHWLWVEL